MDTSNELHYLTNRNKLFTELLTRLDGYPGLVDDAVIIKDPRAEVHGVHGKVVYTPRSMCKVGYYSAGDLSFGVIISAKEDSGFCGHRTFPVVDVRNPKVIACVLSLLDATTFDELVKAIRETSHEVTRPASVINLGTKDLTDILTIWPPVKTFVAARTATPAPSPAPVPPVISSRPQPPRHPSLHPSPESPNLLPIGPRL